VATIPAICDWSPPALENSDPTKVQLRRGLSEHTAETHCRAPTLQRARERRIVFEALIFGNGPVGRVAAISLARRGRRGGVRQPRNAKIWPFCRRLPPSISRTFVELGVWDGHLPDAVAFALQPVRFSKRPGAQYRSHVEWERLPRRWTG
jgi:hypothetical protein